jgi:hypothetical protein
VTVAVPIAAALLEEHPPFALEQFGVAPVVPPAVTKAKESLHRDADRNQQTHPERQEAHPLTPHLVGWVQADERRDDDAANDGPEPKDVMQALKLLRTAVLPLQVGQPARAEEGLLQVVEPHCVNQFIQALS